MNRISPTNLLFRAVKCVVEEIEEKDPEYYKKEIPEHYRSDTVNDSVLLGCLRRKEERRWQK